MIGARSSAIIALIIAAVAFGGGYKTSSWRCDAGKLKAERAATSELAALTAERDRIAADLAAANDLHADELRRAQDATNDLRNRLDAGSVRLRIAAKCPPAKTAPAAASATVDTGARAELDAAARRAYFRLRDGINRASAQLAACQGELKIRMR